MIEIMKLVSGRWSMVSWLRTILCASIVFSFFHSSHAQTRIVGDVAVTQMVERHVELNSRVKTIPGFRVQIASFSGVNAKSSAFNLRDQFMTDYPLVQAYIVFDEPNFKVKVGDFRTKLEAYAFLQEIKEVYKGYIIRDNILPEQPVQEELAPDDEEMGISAE